MKQRSIFPALLLALCLLLSGCGLRAASRPPLLALRSTHPNSLSTLLPLSDSRLAVSWADYEGLCTTVQVIDAQKDVLCHQLTLDGVWDLKPQSFADGRLALCQRDTNTWKFLSADLVEQNDWQAETVDGFFTRDGAGYYYLADHVLYCQDTATGSTAPVPLELRLLELTACSDANGALAMQFFLSPYSTECGTAIFDVAANTLTMLQASRYQVTFDGDSATLLRFDDEKMGYSVLRGSGDAFHFADAALFTGGDLYAINGSPYLMGVSAGSSTLFTVDGQIQQCPLSGCGIGGEMYSACYLPDAALLVGAIYESGSFQLYAIDPAQLSFTTVADATPVASPLAVDEALYQSYWLSADRQPLSADLRQARQYADDLQQRYGVQILLSAQCREGAALCDRTIQLSDALDAGAELDGVNRMLAALERGLSLYPEGFFRQFRTGAGDGGLCFLLVGSIESNFPIAACTYENFDWQYIALDILQVYGLDSIVCHEIWHATENYALGVDFSLFNMDQWDALNPEGFLYLNDATLQNPQQPGLLYNSALNEIHFVDSYSCVDRHEDRARIMEYFMVHDDEAQLLIQSPFIRQKLQIMCDAVRAAFDTTGWQDVRWERLL